MRRIKNITEFYAYEVDHTELVYHANTDDGMISGELEINTVGPCVARLQLPNEGKKPGKAWLLGTYEGHETISFSIDAPLARVVLEPSGEVWWRRSEVFASNANPNPEETFTRMEKPGLYQDELGIALHRQATLNRIYAAQEGAVADAHTKRLERMIAEMSDKIEALTPKPDPAVVLDPPADTTQQSQTTE